MRTGAGPSPARWRRDGGGNCLNLPVPRGLNDTEMAAIRETLILPAVAAFEPEAIVLQCGRGRGRGGPAVAPVAVEQRPLGRSARAERASAARGSWFLGGGGYNPWSVGRLWAGVWAVLNGHDIPERLPKDAEEVLRALRWDRSARRPQPAGTLVHDPARRCPAGPGAPGDHGPDRRPVASARRARAGYPHLLTQD